MHLHILGNLTLLGEFRLINLSRKLCGLGYNVGNILRQTGRSALCVLHDWGDWLRICNAYYFSTATTVTRTQRTVTLHVQCLFCSMLRSIAVHMHSVFCVPCTVCDNVQQCADTAILCGNCSAVWDAVSLQYTCTEGSVSVHVHHQVPHTRTRENVFRGNIVHYFSENVGKYLALNFGTKNDWEKEE